MDFCEEPLLKEQQPATQLIPLQTQVAGHSSANGKSSSGLLLYPGGKVLKPLEKKDQGENELNFYKFLDSTTNPLALQLQEFVPRFYGTVKLNVNGKEINYIILQDVTDQMKEPCVMDVKIGKQTWEPSASEEKRNLEDAKYVEAKKECGFCIPGMQFYSISEKRLLKHEKNYGKTLDKNGMENAFKNYLNWNISISQLILLQFLCKLWKIIKWFHSQKQYKFYSSSLLFVYDAYWLKTHSSNWMQYLSKKSKEPGVKNMQDVLKRFISSDEDFETKLNSMGNELFQKLEHEKHTIMHEGEMCSQNQTELKMIDFAHTKAYNDNMLDTNYLEGLKHLFTMLATLLMDTYEAMR